MIKIKEILVYEKTNWLEVTWVKEIVTQVEVEKDGELVIEDKIEVIQIHCESFGDSDEYIQLLRDRALEFNTSLDEYEELISIVISNRSIPTEDELLALKKENEKQRILSIKAEAGRIIESRYSIIWQLNHPRMDIAYASEYAWIDSIRAISNEAEINGTALEDINWGNI